MSTIRNEAIKELFVEIFQGTAPGADGTWFVQGTEALNATFADLTADEASWAAGDGVSTIAAHVIHMTYYLELANDNLRGTERQGDWAGSWQKQEVTEVEWQEAKEALVRQREAFLAFVESGDLSSDQEVLTHVLANLGHAAYHLGAIRQLYLVVKANY